MFLANLVRTFTDNHWIDFWGMTILCCELLCCVSNELVIQLILNEVDGTTTEATTHDAGTSYAILLSNVVEEVELFTATSYSLLSP